MKVRAVALLMVVMAVQQCGAPAGKDAGGDNNPQTGACEVKWEETLGKANVYHRYPEMSEDGKYVYGKAIFNCERPPETHNATIHIEYMRDGTWRSIGENSTSEVPRSRWSVIVQVSCRVGDWRLRVEIKGTSRDAKGRPQPFEVEEKSRTRNFRCGR